MKKYLIIGLISLAACKNNESADSSDYKTKRIEEAKHLYNQSRELNDPFTAITALQTLLIYDSTNAGYWDSLTTNYERSGLYLAMDKANNRLMALDPQNIKGQERQARGKVGAGKTDDAAADMRNLYNKTKDIKYLFQVAMIYIQKQKMDEAQKTIAEIELVPGYENGTVDLPAGSQGELQKVPNKAATTYFKGLFQLQKRNEAAGITLVKQALAIYPDFFLAQKDMETFEKMRKQGGQPGMQQGPPPQRP